jgi:hypothetical protein
MSKTFTVRQFVEAAEQGKYANYNDSYIQYASGRMETPVDENDKVLRTCVIGEAFLNLGMIPNGYSPYGLSKALQVIKPDNGRVEIEIGKDKDFSHVYDNLSDFINDLNSYPAYRGKKRMGQLIRKYFSKSMDEKIVLEKSWV